MPSLHAKKSIFELFGLSNQQFYVHAKGAIRYAEKRRTSTCTFADRIAKTSIQCYHETVPSEWRERNQQICLATIVACWKYNSISDDDGGCGGDGEHNQTHDSTGSKGGRMEQDCDFQVVGLGVGTKFLSNPILVQEEEEEGAEGASGGDDGDGKDQNDIRFENYGMRIRDSHAEILARRAFRKYLLSEMHSSLLLLRQEKSKIKNGTLQFQSSNKKRNILEYDETKHVYRLQKDVTIHMYSSSTPCGNSCVKKFAQMSKETFQSQLQPDEWPEVNHESIKGHSIHLGQFSLLVKKDNNIRRKEGEDTTTIMNLSLSIQPPLSKKQKSWPAMIDDSWCPPGTSTVYHGKGTIHTCSDKICRWNCMGLQGSLLSPLFDDCPIYLTTFTVGRKFTSSICQRAICCRATNGFEHFIKKNNKSTRKRKNEDNEKCNECRPPMIDGLKFNVNHPSIMGTAIYLDESGGMSLYFSSYHSMIAYLIKA